MFNPSVNVYIFIVIKWPNLIFHVYMHLYDWKWYEHLQIVLQKIVSYMYLDYITFIWLLNLNYLWFCENLSWKINENGIKQIDIFCCKFCICKFLWYYMYYDFLNSLIISLYIYNIFYIKFKKKKKCTAIFVILVTLFIMHELLLNMQEDNCTLYEAFIMYIYIFSSPGPMVPVRYCCHFASIVIISLVIVC